MKRVVLVRPQGPRNVGSVLRAALNFGPTELLLVRPERPALLLHPDFTQMAHGVEDLERRVRIVPSLAEALTDATASYGFTARARDHRTLFDWRDLREEIARRCASDTERVALVFGSEESGLSEPDELQTLVRIPTSDEHGSLNLAMAVGIVLSTVHLAAAPAVEDHRTTPVSGAERRFLIARLAEALGPCCTSAPARRDLLASIERVFQRAELETRDARAWHLLARALAGERAPRDFGIPGSLEAPVPDRPVEGSSLEAREEAREDAR
jgi:tRNA/rRNA methyltransferase